MGPLRGAGKSESLSAAVSPEREAVPAPVPSSKEPSSGDRSAFSPSVHEDERQGRPLPAFGNWAADEKTAKAEQDSLRKNPYRQGHDLATAKASQDSDQALVDHVCGKGCGCSKMTRAGGDDPLKSLENRDAEVRRHEQEHLDEAGEFARWRARVGDSHSLQRRLLRRGWQG